MKTKMKRNILRKFGEFITSTKGKEMGAKKDDIGARIRVYRGKYKKDELSAKAALLLLLDCELIEEIHYKDF